jgi:hypothetical protein
MGTVAVAALAATLLSATYFTGFNNAKSVEQRLAAASRLWDLRFQGWNVSATAPACQTLISTHEPGRYSIHIWPSDVLDRCSTEGGQASQIEHTHMHVHKR